MTKFSRVRDIINDYERHLLPAIQQELASCNDEEDYVYGRHMVLNEHEIWNCDLGRINTDNCDYTVGDIAPINDYQDISSQLREDNVRFELPNSHQKWHYPKNVYQKEIQDIKKLNIQDLRFTNFEHLYDIIRTIFILNNHPNAILTIYDTALRIGYNHAEPILPNKFVYLYGEKNNTGPWGGAVALYGLSPWIIKNVDKDYPVRVKTRWFADKFPNLSAWEIESILCLYRKHFTLNMPY